MRDVATGPAKGGLIAIAQIYGDALERVFVTLRFLWKKLPNHRGFFYHFANPETGERMFDSEVSSVDTDFVFFSQQGVH